MKARKTLRDVLFYLASVGLGIGAYVTLSNVLNHKLLCVGAVGCSTVQASAYAKQWGIPVSALGLVACVVLALLAARWSELGDARPVWIPLVAWGLTLTGVLYSGYLTGLEVWVLGAYCSWCLASAAVQVGSLIVTLLLVRAEARVAVEAPATSPQG